MAKGVTLAELFAKVQADEKSKRDLIVDPRNMKFEEDGMFYVDGVPYSPTDHFHSQIQTGLKIHADYWKRMRVEAPGLLAYNANHWLKENAGKNRMIRTFQRPDGNVARAYLSDGFKVVDHPHVLATVLPALQEIGNFELYKCDVTERKLHLQIIMPGIRGEVKVGDVVRAGAYVRNGELGDGSIEVGPFVDRLACLNGMVINDSKMRMRAAHIGKRKGVESEHTYILSEEAKAAEQKAVLLAARDVLKDCLTGKTFQAILTTMREAAQSEPAQNAGPAARAVAETFALNQGEGEMLMKNLIEGLDYTKWGMANAMTALAHGTEDFDKASEFEAKGHKILTLGSSEWREIAKAA